MSDTPRTDAEDAIWQRDYNNHRECDWPPISDVVSSEFARQLERELTEARTRIKELADVGGALADNVGCGCIDGGCKTCRRSLKDWEEAVKRCLEGIA